MLFAHDTEVALRSAAALVNTCGPPDELSTLEDLDAFVRSQSWSGSRTRTAAELDEVRAVRPALRAIWTAPLPDAVDRVNAVLRAERALPQLVTHDGLGYHIHATSQQSALATRMAVEAAMALVDVFRGGQEARLKVCADADCTAVLIDLTKNVSRRFCDGGCAGRAHSAAYRARQRASTLR